MDKIPFIKPKLPNPDLIAADLKKIYHNNFYSNGGPFYHKFARRLERYLDQNLTAVVVSNATQGLLIAMKAVFGDAQQKKYIAIPSFTFAAAPLAIKWCGFQPLFFDVEPDSGQPDIKSFKKLLAQYKNEIAGVTLLNNFGIGMRNIDEWNKLLKYHDLPYIIDSAPGFGSTYANGKALGAQGECEVFSFHATKPFGIGEGGLVTTKDATLAERLERMKNFGFNKEKQVIEFGTNAKITELDCAIGIRVLDEYVSTLQDRRNTYSLYVEELKGVVDFLPNAETAAIQFTTILLKDGHEQSLVLKELAKNNIEARTYYAPAVHTFPAFSNGVKVDLSNTQSLSSRVVSLPVHPNMSPLTIKTVCNIIKGIL